MNDSSTITLTSLLVDAKAGDRDSLGRLLAAYQNYLHLLARTQLSQQVRSRVSPSDIVQETMLEAHCGFQNFAGNSDGEFFAWLRKILANNLSRAIEQHLLTAKRDVRREVTQQSIHASLDQSALRLEAMLADQRPQVESQASLQEDLIRLADALVQLPPDYRDVIVMRHFEDVSFAEIATRMNRSSGATRMLWLRAISQLKQLMKELAS